MGAGEGETGTAIDRTLFAVAPPAWQHPWHGPVPEDAPRLSEVHAVHDRYVVDVVEARSLCPFARKCREMGRLHRIPFVAGDGVPSPAAVATALAETVQAHPDAEIVLLVVVPPATHPFWASDRFDGFTREVRMAYDVARRGDPTLPRFYAVSFHPLPPAPSAPPTPENLVPTLRRSPDPLIQCVRADMLDALRAESQRAARERLERELAAIDPSLRAQFGKAILTDPELSSDIARHNFESSGTGAARADLEATLDRIFAERCRRYPEAYVPAAFDEDRTPRRTAGL
ncbi:MAG: hypothetical protein D6705_09565 [Deltaproteobacteria bacterium]|nr:MAG: hypothetical protein D6705_09565 [Deltaproteobacteria bacterium]